MEQIKCKFNLFQEGRKYTGHHRNYILESARKVCYDPATREGISLREKLGYLGHGRRQLAGKLALGEVETVKLPDGSTIIVENVPSNVTTHFEIHEDGTVEHTQDILESAPGKVVSGLNRSKVGGFSWAMGGRDGGAIGATHVNGFEGYDYVMNPGFSANRGYILESADGPTREMILESIHQAGVEEKEAEKWLQHWAASSQLELLTLQDRIVQAEIFEDALRAQLEEKAFSLTEIESKLTEALNALEDTEAKRRRIVLEGASKSAIVIPENVVNALLGMSNEADFYTLVGFFEAAKRVDLDGLPIGDHDPHYVRGGYSSRRDPKNPEYGSAMAGYEFD
jgi:hypothetical protein